jgi:hypothetical protein
MALTQVPIELSSTPGIVDNSNATAITIDSSENVLVGKTATAVSSEGVEVRNNGLLVATRDSNKAAILNRRTSDGDILEFNKDSVAVGSIGVNGDRIYLSGASEGVYIDDSLNSLSPCTTTGGNFDNHMDLGGSASRFKDLYLSGTVNASQVNLADAGGTLRNVLDLDGSSNLKVGTGSSAGSRVITFFTENTEQMRLDASGNVGINNANPTGKLHIGSGSSSAAISGSADELVLDNAGNAGITIATGSSAVASLFFADAASNASGYIQYTHSNDALAFATNNGTERMRIDSSGTLLVGKTSSDAATPGHEIKADGAAWHTADSTFPLFLNRETTDGELIRFRKDNVTFGFLSTLNGGLYLASNVGNDSGLRFSDRVIHPCTVAGAPRDDAISLGYASGRFEAVYAANGTIQTSDRNEKQDIEELTDAEQRVAVAAKGLLRKYRWKSAVAEKGDDARIHFGIIAQDLQDAFTAEGLDAARYGMWCSDTFWVDSEGETYDTQEEAPEGATEKTRLGVRYSELLAFIISAI